MPQAPHFLTGSLRHNLTLGRVGDLAAALHVAAVTDVVQAMPRFLGTRLGETGAGLSGGDPRWRTAWDWALFASGAVAVLLFGVAVGKVIQSVPCHFTEDLHAIYQGAWSMKFVHLLDAFSVLAGVVSLAMLVMHGGARSTLKAEGMVQTRARAIGSVAPLVAVVVYALAGVWMACGIEGRRIVGDYVTGGPSNPLHFEAEKIASWLTAYSDQPWIVLAPVMGILGGLLTFLGLRARREVSTVLLSKMAILGVISSVGRTMFPFIMPSSFDP
jgi:cytochrome d ubiquinol oxidase subunit II